MPSQTSAQPQFVSIHNEKYYIWSSGTLLCPTAHERLQELCNSPLVPATSVLWDKESFDERDLEAVLHTYSIEDDVWCASFQSFIFVLKRGEDDCHISHSSFICTHSEGTVPAGPVVIDRKTGEIFVVARVVEDTHHAFICALSPAVNDDGKFREIANEFCKPTDTSTQCMAEFQQENIQIAVPSRLYYNKTPEKPLAGLRFGVKDTIAVNGLRTSFGSLAWQDLYPPKDFTAPCVQRLLDAGAVLIGKLVASEFAEGVEPDEWVNGFCPLNPRGDGEQKPSSSSTGSAVAIAAYDWLDFTLGTDTGGSIRHPAGVNGVFGQRPTTGVVNLKGVLGATHFLDTVGVLARSAKIFSTVGMLLAGKDTITSLQPHQRKYNLLYPVREAPTAKPARQGPGRWFPHPDAHHSVWTDGERQIEEVVKQIEGLLHCQRTYFNIYDFWTATAPKGQSKSLDEATGRIYGDITTASACVNGINQYIADYEAAHPGQQAPMGKIVRARMEYGRTLPDNKISAAFEAMAVFKRWMETTFFAPDDPNTTTLLVFPQSLGRPDYRHDSSRWNGNLFIETFSIYAFGYLCGCPDYTLPIGELSYHSRVTKQSEYLPVSLSLVGKPGADRELFEVVDILHHMGIVNDVAAGTRIYGNIKKNRWVRSM